MKKIIKIAIILFLFSLLILVRAFAVQLFYDPFIAYFNRVYCLPAFPEINTWKLVLGMFFRFAINTIISISIIWFFFKNKSYVKFGAIFLTLTFALLMPVFLYQISHEFQSGYLFPFYIRRLIIHPVLLLILLPAFYYQKLSDK